MSHVVQVLVMWGVTHLVAVLIWDRIEALWRHYQNNTHHQKHHSPSWYNPRGYKGDNSQQAYTGVRRSLQHCVMHIVQEPCGPCCYIHAYIYMYYFLQSIQCSGHEMLCYYSKESTYMRSLAAKYEILDGNQTISRSSQQLEWLLQQTEAATTKLEVSKEYLL